MATFKQLLALTANQKQRQREPSINLFPRIKLINPRDSKRIMTAKAVSAKHKVLIDYDSKQASNRGGF